MPAKSKRQQRLFGMALAYKRGELGNASAEVRRLAGQMTEEQLEEFARTGRKGLPERVAKALTWQKFRTGGSATGIRARMPHGTYSVLSHSSDHHTAVFTPADRRTGERELLGHHATAAQAQAAAHAHHMDVLRHGVARKRQYATRGTHMYPRSSAVAKAVVAVRQAPPLVRRGAPVVLSPPVLLRLLQKGEDPRVRERYSARTCGVLLKGCRVLGVLPPPWLVGKAVTPSKRRHKGRQVTTYVVSPPGTTPIWCWWRAHTRKGRPVRGHWRLLHASSPVGHTQIPARDTVRVHLPPEIPDEAAVHQRIRESIPEAERTRTPAGYEVAGKHAEAVRKILTETVKYQDPAHKVRLVPQPKVPAAPGTGEWRERFAHDPEGRLRRQEFDQLLAGVAGLGVATGGVDALTPLERRFLPAGDPETLEDRRDAVATGLGKVFENLHRFEPGTNFVGLVREVVRNVFWDELARRRAEKRGGGRVRSIDEPLGEDGGTLAENLPGLGGPDPTFESVAAAFSKRQLQGAVNDALAGLAGHLRPTAALLIQGLGATEIASRLNVPMSRAANWIRGVRLEFQRHQGVIRAYYERYGELPPDEVKLKPSTPQVATAERKVAELIQQIAGMTKAREAAERAYREANEVYVGFPTDANRKARAQAKKALTAVGVATRGLEKKRKNWEQRARSARAIRPD